MPETLWRIEAGPADLSLKLVQRSMLSKERVVKAAAIAGDDKGTQLKTLLGKNANRCFLSLARDHGIVRQLQLPVDVQQDLKSALTLQIEGISSWPEQEVYWDHLVERPAEKSKWLTITVVIIPKSILDPWLQLFESCSAPLSGATLEGYDVNVIPPRLRRRSAKAQLVASYALAACLVVLAIAFFFREPYQQRVYASQIQHEITRLEPDVKSLVREESELNAVTKRFDQLQKYATSRDENLKALSTLATALPPDTFIVSYRYQNETITVSGVSASALNVQGALAKSMVFTDVQFGAPITRDATGKDRFALTMSVKGRP
ncbi:MAG TPA: PilN domain-containing protein [Terriglobia bacterium]|jgi:general secretion pathway protein L